MLTSVGHYLRNFEIKIKIIPFLKLFVCIFIHYIKINDVGFVSMNILKILNFDNLVFLKY